MLSIKQTKIYVAAKINIDIISTVLVALMDSKYVMNLG